VITKFIDRYANVSGICLFGNVNLLYQLITYIRKHVLALIVVFVSLLLYCNGIFQII